MENDSLPIQIKKAAKTLKICDDKWKDANYSRKKSLLEDLGNSPIFLQVTLKKIPELSSIQMISVPLPHSLLTDTSEVCLITGDLDKRDKKADIEPTILHYKELLARHGVTSVTKVIPLRQLRTEYKAFEAKRQLYGAYETFLADNKIAGCLPKVLGKFFFKKRKYPQQINLKTSNLKRQIENSLSRTVFFLTGKGSSFSSEVAHFGLPMKQIVANIKTAIDTLQLKIPGKWPNINGLYIKTSKSVSIPIYISLESANSVDMPVLENNDDDVEAEEITTLRQSKVKVYPDGTVELVPNFQNVSDDEDSDFEKRLLEKQKLVLARKSMKKIRIMQIYKTKKTQKKKKNVRRRKKQVRSPVTKEEKPEDGDDRKVLKKRVAKKKKIDTVVNIKGLGVITAKKGKADVNCKPRNFGEPISKKQKIVASVSNEKLKQHIVKEEKITPIGNASVIKEPNRKKKRSASDIKTRSLNKPCIKKLKMNTNESCKEVRQKVLKQEVSDVNISTRKVKEPFIKKKLTDSAEQTGAPITKKKKSVTVAKAKVSRELSKR